MAAQISVESANETRFEVTIREEGGSETRHIVTVEPAYAHKLAPHSSAEDLLRRSFEFLLEHEPKESILRQFNLRDISRYFPDYEAEIHDQLSR